MSEKINYSYTHDIGDRETKLYLHPKELKSPVGT